MITEIDWPLCHLLGYTKHGSWCCWSLCCYYNCIHC